MATPSKPLKDAIAEYQAKNPYSQAAFEGLFPYLQKAGYNVARTTHANNTLASNDALVDTQGNVYDLALNSDNAPGGGTPGWRLNPAGGYDPNRAIVGPDGKFIKYSEWAAQYQTSGAPAPGQPPAAGGSQQPGTVLGGYQPIVMGQGGVPGNFGNRTKLVQSVIDKVNLAKYKVGAQQQSDPYAAARDAASRQRFAGSRGGRRSTILGGFGTGSPSTRRATVLGY